MTDVRYLSAPFPVETEMVFVVSDGRTLIFRRGVIQCRVSLQLEPQPYERNGDQDITARLLVTDDVGQVFMLERRIPCNRILHLVKQGRPQGKEPTGRFLIEGAQCHSDQRDYIPAVGQRGGDFVGGFAYFTKHFRTLIDIGIQRESGREMLYLRVHPVVGGAIGSEDAPMVSVRTEWAAVLVLWPGLISEHSASEVWPDPPVFRSIDEHAEPQVLVTCRQRTVV